MSTTISRRDFLRLVGIGGLSTPLLGCDLPSTVTLEEGQEDIVSYLLPGEHAIPGVGVWYASTCAQCAAGCGIHGRVREGRALKIEGNPDSPINRGKTCQMGQAGLQGHYNPDRITAPMQRVNGELVAVSWEKALGLLKEKTGPESASAKGRQAWVTGTVSGHQRALLNTHLEAVGSASHHYCHEVVNATVWQAVSRDMLGDEIPRLRLDKAALVLSFGADFLGTWLSPVHFARQFSQFRSPPNRGALIQVESKMSLTGANADLWVPIRPGTEGALALGIANHLLNQSGISGAGIPDEVRDRLRAYELQKTAEITGVDAAYIQRIADALHRRSPSLVLAGPSVEGHEQGYDAVAAVMLLNLILGNVGKTIEPGGSFPLPQLATRAGNTRDLMAFADAVQQGRLDVVFFYGANPLYTAPTALDLGGLLQQRGPFKIALAQFPDETVAQADLVLPMASYLEDWGTHVAPYQPDSASLSLQQPLMEPLHAATKGLGDVVLSLLKMHRPDEYGVFPDYYTYLKNAFAALRTEMGGGTDTPERFWNQSLQKGLVHVARKDHALSSNITSLHLTEQRRDAEYPFFLAPSPRIGLFDGRHANLPWLQESPDPINKVVWDSWAEIHPSAAAKLGIAHGDIIRIASRQGAIEVKAYLTKVVHPDVVAVPLGQGHTAYGRYAKGLGVNPLGILDPIVEKKTGELAMYATRVKIAPTDQAGTIVRMGGSDSQVGRGLVRTIPAGRLKRTEGA